MSPLIPEQVSKWAILTYFSAFTPNSGDASIRRFTCLGEAVCRDRDLDGYTTQEIVMFEKLLSSQKRELLQDAEKTVNEMTDKDPQFADPADRASWESESIRDLRIRDRERKLLEKIDEALGRLADGTYGECDECGELITVGRMRARPVTTFCIECKAAQEVVESRPNHKRG